MGQGKGFVNDRGKGVVSGSEEGGCHHVRGRGL